MTRESEDPETGWHIGPKTLFPPAGASDVLHESIAKTPQPDVAARQIFPQSDTEWLAIIAAADEGKANRIQAVADQVSISIEKDVMAGVKVYHVTPPEIDPRHEDHLFIYVHGGAYILNRGRAGTAEAALIAYRSKMRVLSIDYRMPPKHAFPADLEDVVAVYQHLLGQRLAKSMAMGGSSAGGGLTLAATQKFIELGLEVPGTLYAGTPWSDLTKTGDSFTLNEGVDRLLVTYDGLLEEAARLYAGDHDLNDPLISPIYGDFHGFPPTFLVTGTRDLFLSNTVRTHTKMRAAGVAADLLVHEGVSHGDYGAEMTSPESFQTYAELNAFLLGHLQ